jgi:hypothetical protein
VLLHFLTEFSRFRFTRAQLQQLCKSDSAGRLQMKAKSVGNLLGLLIRTGQVTVQEGEGAKSTYGARAVAAVRRGPTRKELTAERRQALIDHAQARPLKTAPRPKFKSLCKLGYKTAAFGMRQKDRDRAVLIAGAKAASTHELISSAHIDQPSKLHTVSLAGEALQRLLTFCQECRGCHGSAASCSNLLHPLL